MRHATLKQQYESWGESSRRAAVRAGGPAARRPQTAIWPRLTASNAVNYHFLHGAKIDSAADLRIRVVGCHELVGQLYMIPEYGSLNI